MKIIGFESGLKSYLKLFKHVQEKSSPMVLWQVKASGERTVTESKLHSHSIDAKNLTFQLSQSDLDPSLTVYVYSEEEQFIFKSRIAFTESDLVHLVLPLEIQLLEEPDVKVIQQSVGVISTLWKSKRIPIREVIKPDYLILTSMARRTERDKEYLDSEFNFVSLDEEDKFYADKRESPRARPKSDKSVKLSCEIDSELRAQRLFDLSQGGMSFITSEAQLYPVGSRIKIVGFEDFVLDDPLIAKIMSHRPVDELKLDFKIGCKFIEGQE